MMFSANEPQYTIDIECKQATNNITATIYCSSNIYEIFKPISNHKNDQIKTIKINITDNFIQTYNKLIIEDYSEQIENALQKYYNYAYNTKYDFNEAASKLKLIVDLLIKTHILFTYNTKTLLFNLLKNYYFNKLCLKRKKILSQKESKIRKEGLQKRNALYKIETGTKNTLSSETRKKLIDMGKETTILLENITFSPDDIEEDKIAFYNLLSPIIEVSEQNPKKILDTLWGKIYTEINNTILVDISNNIFPELHNVKNYINSFVAYVSCNNYNTGTPLNHHQRYHAFLNSYSNRILSSMKGYHLFTQLEIAIILNLKSREEDKLANSEHGYKIQTGDQIKEEELSKIDELTDIYTKNNESYKYDGDFDKKYESILPYLKKSSLYDSHIIAQFTNFEQLILTEISLLYKTKKNFRACKICNKLFIPYHPANTKCPTCREANAYNPKKVYNNKIKADHVKNRKKRILDRFAQKKHKYKNKSDLEGIESIENKKEQWRKKIKPYLTENEAGKLSNEQCIDKMEEEYKKLSNEQCTNKMEEEDKKLSNEQCTDKMEEEDKKLSNEQCTNKMEEEDKKLSNEK